MSGTQLTRQVVFVPLDLLRKIHGVTYMAGVDWDQWWNMVAMKELGLIPRDVIEETKDAIE